jgi:hypothetical protein
MKKVRLPPSPRTSREMTMQPHDPPPPAPRETLLTIVLTGVGAAAFLFFLILITGGFFFWLTLAVAAVIGLGFFHYVLWGYAMTQEVAEERAQAAQRDALAAEEPWQEGIQRKP